MKATAAIIAGYALYGIVMTPVVLVLAVAGEPLADLGWAGVILFAIAFAMLAALLIPSSFMKLAAGALFGFGAGVIAGGLGAFIGAFVPFAIVRGLGGRNWVERRLREPLWRAIDGATAENGVAITILIRLSLVLPYNFSNYALAASGIRIRDYTIGNLATIGPTLLYAWWGAALGNLAHIATGTGPERDALWWTVMGLSVLLTIAGSIWMHHETAARLDALLEGAAAD